MFKIWVLLGLMTVATIVVTAFMTRRGKTLGHEKFGDNPPVAGDVEVKEETQVEPQTMSLS